MVKHGVTIKGPPCYCPVIICEGTANDIYVCEVNDGELGYYEKVNREALKKYAASEVRWKNNTAVRDFDIRFSSRGKKRVRRYRASRRCANFFITGPHVRNNGVT